MCVEKMYLTANGFDWNASQASWLATFLRQTRMSTCAEIGQSQILQS